MKRYSISDFETNYINENSGEVVEDCEGKWVLFEDSLISELIIKLKIIAIPVGCMHSYWDIISYGESLLDNKPQSVYSSKKEWIDYVEGLHIYRE